MCFWVSQVEALSNVTVTAVACGAFHSLAVTSSGRLYEWGLVHTDPDSKDEVRVQNRACWGGKWLSEHRKGDKIEHLMDLSISSTQRIDDLVLSLAVGRSRFVFGSSACTPCCPRFLPATHRGSIFPAGG